MRPPNITLRLTLCEYLGYTHLVVNILGYRCGMRVTARGWKRDCGANAIMSADLEDGYEYVDGAYQGGKTYIKKRPGGDIEVLVGPQNVTLGGKYQIIVTLSKEDIIRLFAEAFEDDSHSDVIKMMAEAL